MGLVAMPSSVRIQHIEWSFDRPAQVNRSPYSGARKVVANPWHGMWRARAELAPIVGEANVRAWRAFLAQLKGQINTFLLPATEGVQFTASANAIPTNAANTTVTAQGGGVYRVAKSGGTNGAYDASAITSLNFSSDVTIMINPRQTNLEFAVGLSLNETADMGYTTIDRTLYFRSSGVLTYFEGPTSISDYGAYSTAQYFFLQKIGNSVKAYAGATSDISAATLIHSFTDLFGAVDFDSTFNSSSATVDVMVTYSITEAWASAGAAQGANSVTLTATGVALTAGMFATVTLPSGSKQMVLLTQDIAANVITFEPPLREAISTGAVVAIRSPAAHVALADSAVGWSVDPGTLYGISFDVEEAF